MKLQSVNTKAILDFEINNDVHLIIYIFILLKLNLNKFSNFSSAHCFTTPIDLLPQLQGIVHLIKYSTTPIAPNCSAFDLNFTKINILYKR